MENTAGDQMVSLNKRFVRNAKADQLLMDAQIQARRGDYQQAHKLSIQATRIQPDNVEAWLARSRYSASLDERLFSLSQVHRLDPHHPAAKKEGYQVIWRMLEQDPYLAYLDETDDLYYVRNNAYLSLALPKDRGVPESYPMRKPGRLSYAFRWLGLALIGLLFAGLGTLVFAPLAILSVILAQRHGLSRSDQIRSVVVVLVAGVLLAVAIGMATLLYTHLGS